MGWNSGHPSRVTGQQPGPGRDGLAKNFKNPASSTQIPVSSFLIKKRRFQSFFLAYFTPWHNCNIISPITVSTYLHIDYFLGVSYVVGDAIKSGNPDLAQTR